MQKVLLSSGGLDSFLLAHTPELEGAVHVFVDVGQKYRHKEMKAAKVVADSCNTQLEYVQTAQIAVFEHSSGIIPFRNAELILCAAQFGQAIYLGVIADEINSDKSEEFCTAMENVLNISHRKQYWSEGKEYKICTPYRNVSKTTLVKRYFSEGGDLTTLLQTVSCYDGGEHHCGQCSSCFKRWVALTCAIGADHWVGWGFTNPPSKWKTLSHWANVMGDYSHERAKDICNALHISGVVS